jgi:hypothetical protein
VAVNHLVAGSNPAAGAIFLPLFRIVQLNSLFVMKSHLRRNTVLPIG